MAKLAAIENEANNESIVDPVRERVSVNVVMSNLR